MKKSLVLLTSCTFLSVLLLYCGGSSKDPSNDPEVFTITYNNMEGATNSFDNPSSYSENRDDIVLKDPSKPAQTFCGWYDNSEFNGLRVVSIPAGSTGDREFWAKWETFTGFSGFVTIGAGPSSGRTVSFYRGDGTFAGSTKTGTDGYYEIKNLVLGNYYLGFGEGFWWKSPTRSNPESITLALGDFETASFSIPETNTTCCNLHGVIRDMGENGNTPVPAFKAKITIMGQSGTLYTAWSGPDGSYRFHNLPSVDGPFSMVVTYTGCVNASISSIIVASQVTTSISIDLLRH